MIRALKCWPDPFEEIRLGAKRTEIRAERPEEQRRFCAGDVLVLEEWDPGTLDYTGRRLAVQVARLTRLGETPPEWGLRAGAWIVVMELRRLKGDPVLP